MTGPDRIWINEKWEAYLRPTSDGDTSGYTRRDPAFLAALPEVQAMIAAAIEAAAQTVATQGDSSATEALGQRICCSGHMCGCQGATVEDWLLHLIRALTPADATAALARIVREAEDRGIAMGLRAAAAWASDEANKCDDAAKWGGHRTYVANCKAAAYALRNAVLKIGGIKTDEARKIGGGE